jgi:hypothetical protein
MSALIADEPQVFPIDSHLVQPCRFMVLYNGMPARTQAEHLCRRLGSTFSTEVDFHFSWWMFSVLRNPGLLEMAISEAVVADLILFSFGLSRDVPEEVVVFNERWVGQRQGHGGLLTYLYVEETEEWDFIECPLALHSHFRGAARRAHMDFIAPGPMAQESKWAELPKDMLK